MRERRRGEGIYPSLSTGQPSLITAHQGGTICGAIEESSRSLKSIDKRVFINFRDKYAVFTNFRDKNAVFTRFRDKNDVFEVHDKNTVFGFNFVCSG